MAVVNGKSEEVRAVETVIATIPADVPDDVRRELQVTMRRHGWVFDTLLPAAGAKLPEFGIELMLGSSPVAARPRSVNPDKCAQSSR